MALSGVAAATRAFVTLLLFLANRYHLVLHISRDSSADELSKAFRKVMVKAHPDKGGSKEHAQKLTAARDAWNDARKTSGCRAGRHSGYNLLERGLQIWFFHPGETTTKSRWAKWRFPQ